MRGVWICLALLLAVGQARELSDYHGHGHGHASCSSGYRTEVGYRRVQAPAACGNAYCPHGYYCNRVQVYDCKYFPHGKCPPYAVPAAKCEVYYTKCGDKKCKYDQKCEIKKACKTEYRELPGHGHKTTQEIKTCWDEHFCVKAPVPQKCTVASVYSCCDPYASDYGSHHGSKYYAAPHGDAKCKCGPHELCIKADVKKCVVDPKFAALKAGHQCGHSKCPSGHYCKYACKACGYRAAAAYKCEPVSKYVPVPCGGYYCNPYQVCERKERKVCGDGYGYRDGQHVGHYGGYDYYCDDYYATYQYRYYGTHEYSYYEGGYGGGSHGGSRGSGGSHKSPSKSPAKSPEKSPSPSPARLTATAQAVATPGNTAAVVTSDSEGDVSADIGAASVAPGSASAAAIQQRGNDILQQAQAIAAGAGTTAAGGASSRHNGSPTSG